MCRQPNIGCNARFVVKSFSYSCGSSISSVSVFVDISVFFPLNDKFICQVLSKSVRYFYHFTNKHYNAGCSAIFTISLPLPLSPVLMKTFETMNQFLEISPKTEMLKLYESSSTPLQYLEKHYENYSFSKFCTHRLQPIP